MQELSRRMVVMVVVLEEERFFCVLCVEEFEYVRWNE